MAIDFTAINNEQSAKTSGKNWKQADGFINISTKRANGKDFKLGVIKLTADREDIKMIVEKLNESPEMVTRLMQNCTFRYQPNGIQPGSEIDVDSLFGESSETADESVFADVAAAS